MKNPLALYTGAALATLAALTGLSLTDWPAGSRNSEKAAEVQKPVEDASQTPEKPPEEVGKTPEKPAEEASKTPEKTPEKPAEIAAVEAPEPTKAEADVKPEFDTVRVEKDGQAVVAGRARPGAEVALKLDDQVIGKGIANTDGSWVVVPDNPLPKGAHELTVEQKAADSAPVTSAQSIAVAVPETAGQQAMVALTEPGTATKVLQSGGDQPQAKAPEAEKPVAVEQQTKAPETAEKPPEPGQAAGEAQESQASQPAATAEKQPESTEPARQAEEPVAQTTTVAKTEELPEAVKPEEAAPPPTAKPAKAAAVPLRLDAVDYNDKGDIIFSGRAKPGSAIRLYVDNGRVGDAMADARGNWSFSGKDIIAPGTHDLRADQIDATGKVMARIELPFLRENAEAVAALNPPPAVVEPQEAIESEPSQPAENQPQQPAESQPPQPAESQPPQPAESQPTQPAEIQPTQIQPSETSPPQTAEVQPPQTAAEVQPPAATETAKTQPEASGPAPEQPVAEDKKEEVTTAAAAAAEQAAKAIDPDQPRSGKVVIQPGNNLWKLSRVIYGRGINFTVIYQANKDQIRNPNRIYPGQIFAIPNATPPEMIDPKRKDPLTSAEGGAVQ